MPLQGFSVPEIGWVWEPSVLTGLALLAGAYAWFIGPLRRRYYGWGGRVPAAQQFAFYGGVLAVFLALISPLDTLADRYLFSAHMAQHMLLTFVAPPLWLMGCPDWLIRELVLPGKVRRWMGFLTRPLPAFLIFNGTMWAWHVPSAYDAALENELLHVFEHLLFIGAAVIGWWPVFGLDLDHDRAPSPAVQAGYAFASMFACTGLAALITLSPTRLYPFYMDYPRLWGLSPMLDQQIGGQLMWMPGDLVLLLSLLGAVGRWLNASPQEEAPEPAQ